jgi:Fe-only nitrogenase accessory protein AnfO
MCRNCSSRTGPEIAVVLDANGNTARLTEPGRIVVYRKTGCSWDAIREIPFFLDMAKGLRETREKMGELLVFLGPCKLFVAKAAGGALFYELEKAGCSIWEIAGQPNEFLDTLVEDEEKEKAASLLRAAGGIPAPTEVAPGKFTVSIRDVQGKTPLISSKQILQAFIGEGKFTELEVICDHVPPWIEMEAARLGYAMETGRLGENKVRVLLVNAGGG